MVQLSDRKSSEILSNEHSSPDTMQPPARFRSQHHWYVREIIVGVAVMVIGSFVVWRLGIGRQEPTTNVPAPNAVKEERAEPESIFTRDVYAKIQPGLTAWQVEDLLGPPALRQRIPLGAPAGLESLYNLKSGRLSGSPASPGNVAATGEYEEMVWESKRVIGDAYQHIAVLLEGDVVIGRRSHGLE